MNSLSTWFWGIFILKLNIIYQAIFFLFLQNTSNFQTFEFNMNITKNLTLISQLRYFFFEISKIQEPSEASPLWPLSLIYIECPSGRGDLFALSIIQKKKLLILSSNKLSKNYYKMYLVREVIYMVAKFCHHLSDTYVDSSDNYVDSSDNYVDLIVRSLCRLHVFKNSTLKRFQAKFVTSS